MTSNIQYQTQPFSRVQTGNLHVASNLYNFVNNEVLPNTGVTQADFWSGFDAIVQDLAPKNSSLLAERDRLQVAIDSWYQANSGTNNINTSAYRALLENIGYLVPEPISVQITTQNVDSELAIQAGPQLVVPVLNARYALNAANARWGSLYDALYGTDALSEADGCGKVAADGKSYNPVRGVKVIEYAKNLLDECVPLKHASHRDVLAYSVVDGNLQVSLKNGKHTSLIEPTQFVGYQGAGTTPSSVLLVHNRLHLDLIINRTTTIGASDTAGISDVILESALSTILDLEDSVAVVDADDKVLAYRNWLGILQGTLTETIHKGDKTFVRGLNPDRLYITPAGGELKLHGRSLMFLRNVGHLMTNPAILYTDTHDIVKGLNASKVLKEIPEGIMDAMITTAIALHDLKDNPSDVKNNNRSNLIQNSRTGSVYIVKPKMHGPEEVAFSSELFGRVETVLGLPVATVKLGIMDEERRTSVNLKACIAAAANRVAFINTGFLDRTGDEMHTAMHAGVMLRKAEMKTTTWLQTYERNNVLVGLACGLRGKAQIGKGMWAMPDLMGEMLKQKIAHPKSGANTAWVPSPTAATLHALHYHQVDVIEVQNALESVLATVNLAAERESLLTGLLTIPLASSTNWSDAEKQQELDNNVQGILGYVVRWVDQGIGCSKVPDINGIGLMEDRATLRISSQHIANWLHHGILTTDQIHASFARMAKVVDTQNASDPLYIPLTGNENGAAYQAAKALVFEGLTQPNGYTEPLLHAWRLKVKSGAV